MGLAIMVANGIGVYLRIRFNTAAPLGLAVGATAVFTFVGMLALGQETNGPWKITEASMRTAIASSILAQYQALVAIVAFFSPQETSSSGVSQTLISNFTTIVGVVIAFYFGASAYVEGRRITADRRKNSSSPHNTSPEPPQSG
jgi:hypothetical protein